MNVPSAAMMLEQEILASIPLTRAMGLRLDHYDGQQLRLAAPLEPNVNDKGCAFGGSLASVLTLAGWGLVTLRLRDAGEDCDVFVQDSSVRYTAPVWTDFTAAAALAPGESWDDFFGALRSRGKARLRIHAGVADAAGVEATGLEARFVALRRKAA
jgi:thioesterase domain-containing protein